MKKTFLTLLTSALFLNIHSTNAGVIVTENLPAGAGWPETTALQTLNSDAATIDQLVLAAAVAGNRVAGQTFVPATTFTLDSIYITYATSATYSGGSFTLRIQEATVLGDGATVAYNYAPGSNLLSTLTVSPTVSTGGAGAVMKFDLTGADEITLQAGTVYAFELAWSVDTVSGTFYWRRFTGSSYGPGDGFITADNSLLSPRTAISGTSERDLAMALVAVPEPNSPMLIFLGTGILITVQRARRKGGFRGNI